MKLSLFAILALAVAAPSCTRHESSTLDMHDASATTPAASASVAPSAWTIAATSKDPLDVWSLDDGTVLVGHENVIPVAAALAGHTEEATKSGAIIYEDRRAPRFRGTWPSDARVVNTYPSDNRWTRESASDVRELHGGAWAVTLVPKHLVLDLMRKNEGEFWIISGKTPKIESLDGHPVPKLDSDLSPFALASARGGSAVVFAHTEYHDWSYAQFFDHDLHPSERIPRPDLPGCMRPGVDFDGEDATPIAFAMKDAYFAASCAGRIKAFVSRITKEGWSVIDFPYEGGVDSFAVARHGDEDQLWLVTTEGVAWSKDGARAWERVVLPEAEGAQLRAEKIAVSADGDVWISAGMTGESALHRMVENPYYRKSRTGKFALVHRRPGAISIPIP